MAKAKSSAPPAEEQPFEAMMERLERIVERLEDGELPLEESLRAYEEGVALVRKAQGRLDAMDERLEQLNADGSISPLEAEGEDEDAPF